MLGWVVFMVVCKHSFFVFPYFPFVLTLKMDCCHKEKVKCNENFAYFCFNILLNLLECFRYHHTFLILNSKLLQHLIKQAHFPINHNTITTPKNLIIISQYCLISNLYAHIFSCPSNIFHSCFLLEPGSNKGSHTEFGCYASLESFNLIKPYPQSLFHPSHTYLF